MFYAKTTVIAASVAAVNAHMMMQTPQAWNSTSAPLTNGPLQADGSDFPCKFSASYTATGDASNTYALGSDQTLSFQGSAVHGGGSCQIFISYDQPPTANSKLKVIHSIEGGCPARNQTGNLTPEIPTLADPYTYKYTIPSNIPAGKATIGFSWLNRIGNREFYMNCGPVQLTGTGGSQSNYDALPDMLVMNIGSHPQNQENYDYVYENPGNSVENNIGEFPVMTCGTSGCTVGDTSSSGSGSSDSSSSAPAASPTQPTAASSPGGVFETIGGSTPATTAATTMTTATTVATTTAVVTTSTPVAASPTATSTPVSSGSGSSSGALSGACTTEGEWNCIGGTSYQQCASGLWSAVMPVAAGTKCTPGQSSSIDITAAKRAARVFRA
ncbi:lytic polysaccharide monooxygenase [Xylariaceae sp. FL0255]|nr:lytic polysaccharide monooxygenase [Xylariaceae sp. FL0255]